MSQGTLALILIFLEEASGDWVSVADLARRLAMNELRVVEALNALQDYASGSDLTLKIDALDQVIAARMDNGALEAQ